MQSPSWILSSQKMVTICLLAKIPVTCSNVLRPIIIQDYSHDPPIKVFKCDKKVIEKKIEQCKEDRWIDKQNWKRIYQTLLVVYLLEKTIIYAQYVHNQCKTTYRETKSWIILRYMIYKWMACIHMVAPNEEDCLKDIKQYICTPLLSSL